MIQIIYGVKNSGKSEYQLKIAEKVWKETDKKVFFIVPEQYSYETEKTLVERLGIISPKTVEVLSFKRLFHYVISNIGGALLPRLSEPGKKILISRAARKCGDSLKMLKSASKYAGFTDILATLFSEFKRYNNSAEKIKEIADKLEDNTFLKVKMQDIAKIYGEYVKETMNVFTDPEDELTLLAGIIAKSGGYFKNSVFLIDEFEGFTPQELAVIGELAKQADVKITLCADRLTMPRSGRTIFGGQIKTAEKLTELCKKYGIKAEKPVFLSNTLLKDAAFLHLEKNLRNSTFVPFGGEVKNIEIVSALNFNAELNYAARTIISYVRDCNLRFRDFTVAARNIDTYKNIAAEVFILKNWDYDSIFAYLKTGWHNAQADETDLLENYILCTGIRGSSWKSDKEWKYTPKGFDEETVKEINLIRKKISEPVIALEKSLKEGKTVRAYIAAMLNFMAEINFYDRIEENARRLSETENADLAARYTQIYDAVIASFDEIYAVSGDNTETDIAEFEAMLKAAFEAHKVGIIPTSADSVTITDVKRSKAHNAKIMFIIGVNEGVFPEIFSGEGIIKDDERKKLEELGLNMAPDTVSRMLDEEFTVYDALLSPSEKLYLTYPLTDNVGESLAPSSLLRKVKNLLPRVCELDTVTEDRDGIDKIVTSKTALEVLARQKRKPEAKTAEITDALEKWFKHHSNLKYEMVEKSAEYRNETKKLSESILSEIYKGDMRTSVSRLESYRRCPFMYYVSYMLDVSPRAEAVMQSANAGSVMHSVIEALSYKVKNEIGSWQEAADEWINENAEKIADEKINDFFREFEKPEERQIWAALRLKETVKTSACMIAAQLKAGEFIPMGYEISFGDGGKYNAIELVVGGKKVKLRGKIDRSDIYTDENGRKFIRVIDYKSGEQNFSIAKVYYGLSLQLAVYLESLTEQEYGISAGMLYFRLFDPIVKTGRDLTREEAKTLNEAEYKADGLLAADAEIIRKMDSNIGDGKSLLPVKIKADGSFGAYSKIASFEQFEKMNKHIKRTLKKISAEMLAGKIDVRPVKLGDYSPCKYCDYKSVCHFDGALCNSYERLKKMDNFTAWEKISEEGGEQ